MDTENQKNNSSSLDFIIVGQGIAGSVLSISLLNAGFKIKVMDDPALSSCSKVAAGIWNPIVFKRLTKSWLADDVVPELNAFYNYAEDLFGVKLIHQRHVIKPFTEVQEKNLWIKKAQTENIFLDPQVYTDFYLDDLNTISSYSKVLNAGSLDVNTFLEHTHSYLINKKSYLKEVFDHTKLLYNDTVITYKDIQSSNIIFCDGHLISQNPYFKWIPMKPAKGEILTILCKNLNLERDILNKGLFILPLGKDFYKVGATYEWKDLNEDATEKGKLELIHKLNSIVFIPYTIVKHQAGIRPSVMDRRPVAGHHPEFKNMFTFNGFGTKSVMLAPYFAKQLIANFKYKTAINPEVDPARFWIRSKNNTL